MPRPKDATALMARKGTVLLVLALGPLLSAAIFMAMASRSNPPPSPSETGHIYVPWHQSTRLTALEMTWISIDTVDVLTRRDAKSGTTYVIRRIWCATHEFQYRAEGTTERQAKENTAAETQRHLLTEGSISFFVAAYACSRRPNEP